MGANPRELNRSEKLVGGPVFEAKDKAFARSQARRDIEGLNQNDKMIALLDDISGVLRFQAEQLAEANRLQAHTNQLLEWLGTQVLPATGQATVTAAAT